MSELPDPGDPYVAGPGQIIEPTDFGSDGTTEVVNRIGGRMPMLGSLPIRRQLADDDLPEPNFQKQSVIASIVSMRLMGLDEYQISDILGTKSDYIIQVLNSAPAQRTFELIFTTLIHANAATLQGRIASYSNKALTTIVQLMDNPDTRDDVRLKAGQDILDRSGTSPDVFFNQRDDDGRNDDELRIVIMDEDTEKVNITVGKKK